MFSGMSFFKLLLFGVEFQQILLFHFQICSRKRAAITFLLSQSRLLLLLPLAVHQGIPPAVHCCHHPFTRFNYSAVHLLAMRKVG